MIERLLPDQRAHEILATTRDVCDSVLERDVVDYEREERYPTAAFEALRDAGLLSLAFPKEFGGGGQPYEVYLQVLEEIAMRWAAVAVATSVHTLSCHPLLVFGTDEQRQRWLPDMVSGRQIGGYSLSEAEAGSDAGALKCRATETSDGFRINGDKAWITNGGRAHFYSLFARTAEGSKGVSCFLVPGEVRGLSFGTPERKMGLRAVPTTTAHYDDVLLEHDRLIGDPGAGLGIAFSALDSGRLGIAAVATGLAQRALDDAAAYQIAGGAIKEQGIGFALADMAAAVDAARATYLDAARRRDAGMDYSRAASVAKLTATDAAMRVTTAAVQLLGDDGASERFNVERYFREAKITQIFEGTNQIQRLVIARQLAK